MRTIKKAAFIGMGALGILYGAMIYRKFGSEAFTFLADAERIKRYRAQPPKFNGEVCGFTFCEPSKFEGYADFLVFGVKATALQEAIEAVKPIVGPETIILSLLNGISSEEIIEREIGCGTVVHCVAQGMAARRTATSVVCKNQGVVCLGVPKSHPERAPALEAVEAFFRDCGIHFVHEEDIERRIWCKWMFNIGVNQVVAVVEGNFASIQHPGPARDRYIAAMQEVVELAQRLGVDVTQKDLEEYVRLGDTLDPEGMPSLRQDTLAQRHTEVDFFSGTLIEKAHAVGLPVPVNEALYREIKAIEAGWEQVGKS